MRVCLCFLCPCCGWLKGKAKGHRHMGGGSVFLYSFGDDPNCCFSPRRNQVCHALTQVEHIPMNDLHRVPIPFRAASQDKWPTRREKRRVFVEGASVSWGPLKEGCKGPGNSKRVRAIDRADPCGQREAFFPGTVSH